VKDALLVAFGGAIGSVLRWAVLSGASRLPRAGAFPWGTLAVNLAGSCAIGFVLTLAFERGLVAPATRLFLVTGVLGGFTTFSAFSWETLVLVRDGHALAAAGYMAGSVLGGFAAAVLGAALAGQLGTTVASLAA
jgi:CrcB protein